MRPAKSANTAESIRGRAPFRASQQKKGLRKLRQSQYFQVLSYEKESEEKNLNQPFALQLFPNPVNVEEYVEKCLRKKSPLSPKQTVSGHCAVSEPHALNLFLLVQIQFDCQPIILIGLSSCNLGGGSRVVCGSIQSK